MLTIGSILYILKTNDQYLVNKTIIFKEMFYNKSSFSFCWQCKINTLKLRLKLIKVFSRRRVGTIYQGFCFIAKLHEYQSIFRQNIAGNYELIVPFIEIELFPYNSMCYIFFTINVKQVGNPFYFLKYYLKNTGYHEKFITP